MKKIVFFCLIGLGVLVPAPSALGQPDPNDFKRFQELWKQLDDPNPFVSEEAARQLAEMASLMRSSGTRLGMTLESRFPSVRIQAAKTISAMGPTAKGAIIPLIEAIKKEKDEEALYEMLRALAIVPFTRSKISIDKALPIVLPYLKHKNPKIRGQAAGTVGVFHEDALVAVPALRELLHDPTPPLAPTAASVSMIAMEALQRIGAKDKKTVDALFQVIKSNDIEKRARAMATLATLAPKDERVFPMLLQSLKDQDNLRLRFAAAGCLVLLGSDAKEAVPELIRALDFHDPNDRQGAATLRYYAAQALGAIGPAAKTAIPEIRRLADTDPDRRIRREAEKTLEHLEKLQGH